MKKFFRLKYIMLVLLALPVLAVGAVSVQHAYRLNNVCDAGYRIIQSDADAIAVAQSRLFKANYGSHGVSGYLDEKPALVDFSRTDDCCTATRTRNIFGVIVWEVSLRGETLKEPRKRIVGAHILLSNCGMVFVDESYVVAGPPR